MLTLSEDAPVSQCFKNIKLLEHIESPLQTIQLFYHERVGKILSINDEIQHVEAWQCLYHEPLVHLPICFQKKTEHVLILGGGSLFAAAEALKYQSVKSVLLCDHDIEIIKIMRKNYEHAKTVLADPRFTLVVKDVFEFININKEKFDLIINDCFDSVGEKIDFVKISCNHLRKSGVCSDLVYRSIFEKTTTNCTLKRLKKEKGIYHSLSLIAVPEYPGVLHVLTIWGKSRNIDQALKKTKNKEHLQWMKTNESFPFHWFSPKNLRFHLYIPPYMRETLATIRKSSL